MNGVVHMKVLAIVSVLASLIVMVAYWGFLEPPFLSYLNMPFEPVADVQAGQPVLLKVTRCNSTSEEQSYLITHRLIRLDPPPGALLKPVILPAGAVSIDPGCHDAISAANPIPAGTPPGIYFVMGNAKVDGRWRTSSVPWTSRPFRVLPSP